LKIKMENRNKKIIKQKGSVNGYSQRFEIVSSGAFRTNFT